MSTHNKYEEIRKMSAADREEIYRFAMQRSKEMLSGIDCESQSISPINDVGTSSKDKLSFR
ncbi:MAG: hypothetical protein JXR76_08400 [Deltaproteobacteria bacterium]|nr:hypothetical protein [Deltaproteobacteria bacterium]